MAILKTKEQLLIDKVEQKNARFAELTKELINKERDNEDFDHELDKARWQYDEAVKELKDHREWLASIA